MQQALEYLDEADLLIFGMTSRGMRSLVLKLTSAKSLEEIKFQIKSTYRLRYQRTSMNVDKVAFYSALGGDFMTVRLIFHLFPTPESVTHHYKNESIPSNASLLGAVEGGHLDIVKYLYPNRVISMYIQGVAQFIAEEEIDDASDIRNRKKDILKWMRKYAIYTPEILLISSYCDETGRCAKFFSQPSILIHMRCYYYLEHLTTINVLSVTDDLFKVGDIDVLESIFRVEIEAYNSERTNLEEPDVDRSREFRTKQVDENVRGSIDYINCNALYMLLRSSLPAAEKLLEICRSLSHRECLDSCGVMAALSWNRPDLARKYLVRLSTSTENVIRNLDRNIRGSEEVIALMISIMKDGYFHYVHTLSAMFKVAVANGYVSLIKELNHETLIDSIGSVEALEYILNKPDLLSMCGKRAHRGLIRNKELESLAESKGFDIYRRKAAKGPTGISRRKVQQSSLVQLAKKGIVGNISIASQRMIADAALSALENFHDDTFYELLEHIRELPAQMIKEIGLMGRLDVIEKIRWENSGDVKMHLGMRPRKSFTNIPLLDLITEQRTNPDERRILYLLGVDIMNSSFRVELVRDKVNKFM